MIIETHLLLYHTPYFIIYIFTINDIININSQTMSRERQKLWKQLQQKVPQKHQCLHGLTCGKIIHKTTTNVVVERNYNVERYYNDRSQEEVAIKSTLLHIFYY